MIAGKTRHKTTASNFDCFIRTAPRSKTQSGVKPFFLLGGAARGSYNRWVRGKAKTKLGLNQEGVKISRRTDGLVQKANPSWDFMPQFFRRSGSRNFAWLDFDFCVCLLPKRPMKSGSLVRVNFSTSAQIAYRANPELRQKLVFSKLSV